MTGTAADRTRPRIPSPPIWREGRAHHHACEPDFLNPMLFGTMHECGHALYGQGVAPELERTGLEGGASLAVHESQSRMWENLVGRSLPFWEHFYPRLQEVFPQLAGVSSGKILQRHQQGRAFVYPGGSGRGHLQSAHHAAARNGNRHAGRQSGGQRSPRACGIPR